MQSRMAAVIVALVTFSTCVLAADITLVKHARKGRAPQRSTQYIVMKGDTLRSVLTRVYGAKEKDLPELFRQFRKENPGVTDLNLIHAGRKISIPGKGAKITTAPAGKKAPGEQLQVKEVSPDIYVVKQGQHLAQILREVYGISDELIFDEYIDLIKKLNPQISDPDHVIPGQELRLPSVKEVLAAARASQGGKALAATPGMPPAKVQPPVTATPGVPPAFQDKNMITAANPVQGSPAGISSGAARGNVAGTGGTGDGGKAASSPGSKAMRNTVVPALESMGGRQRDKGTYFLPLSGGTSISLDTGEIPVIELDTGKKIIFDTKGMITPEVRAFIEKSFPSFTVISGEPSSLEDLMDKVLSVSGYFSVNRDAGPLLIGEEEKVRFFGKWIVYKDFSRRNVFVINILKDQDLRTPEPIRSYAGRFGIDLVEMGGRDPGKAEKKAGSVTALKHSYQALLGHLGVAFEADREIELVSGGVVRISYKAPLVVGKVILTDTMPDQEMVSRLTKQSYILLNPRTEPLDRVLKAIGTSAGVSPVKIAVAPGRTELELPAMQVGRHLILKRAIDPGIEAYIASTGVDVLVW
ncbi:MAG: LysM peptidoglycan-binding domain-containing protein [Syntrophaceae bacterium]|nr:LysM peptidoglycan-binding domain-containing protein [Deltaproteobacteria bacterium]